MGNARALCCDYAISISCVFSTDTRSRKNHLSPRAEQNTFRSGPTLQTYATLTTPPQATSDDSSAHALQGVKMVREVDPDGVRNTAGRPEM